MTGDLLDRLFSLVTPVHFDVDPVTVTTKDNVAVMSDGLLTKIPIKSNPHQCPLHKVHSA